MRLQGARSPARDKPVPYAFATGPQSGWDRHVGKYARH